MQLIASLFATKPVSCTGIGALKGAFEVFPQRREIDMLGESVSIAVLHCATRLVKHDVRACRNAPHEHDAG